MSMLSTLLQGELLDRIALRKKQRDRVIKKLIKYESRNGGPSIYDEQVWTLLFTYGFVACKNSVEGLRTLGKVLTSGEELDPPAQAWIEMQPLPPRKGKHGRSEGNTEVDLLLGDVGRRGKKSGVRYEPPREGKGWVAMVEAKWLSDISLRTKADRHRNQLVRIIETALTFQKNRHFPVRVHVTMLTPEVFRKGNAHGGGSRLYFYKFREYAGSGETVHKEAIIADIDTARVDRRASTDSWLYPDLQTRIDSLRMHWVTHEELLDVMPDSRFKSRLVDFIASQQPGCVLQSPPEVPCKSSLNEAVKCRNEVDESTE